MGNLIRAANRHRFRNLGPASIAASAWTQAYAADLIGTFPAATSISLNNGGSGVLATVTPSIAYVSGASWLAAQVTGSGNAQLLTLTPTLNSLVAGVYQALVTLTSSGAANSGVQVTVTATVTDTRANLLISPTSISFTATVGQASAPNAQTITATNAGSGTLAPLQVSITGAGASYIGATVNGTGNSQTITIAPSVPPTEGSYDAVVTVSALNATGSPDTVSIGYSVLPSQTVETIGLSRSALSFVASVGNAAPAAQTTEPGNLGPGTLGPVSVGSVVGTAAAYFAFSVSGTGNNQQITATPTVPLAQGNYTLTADVTATNASNTATLSISYAVAAAVPTIALSQSSLSFSQNQGQGNPASQPITVTNSTGGTLAACSTGLSGTDASRFSASVSGSANAQVVTVTALTGALAQGTYTATLTINSAGASNTPVTVALTFLVTAASTIRATTANLPADVTQNADGSFTPTGWRVFGDVPAMYLNGGSAPLHYVGNVGNFPAGGAGGRTLYPYTEAGYRAAIAAQASSRGGVVVVEDHTLAGGPLSFTTSAVLNYPTQSAGGTTYTYVMSRTVYMGTFPRAYGARVAASYADRGSCGVLTFDWTGTTSAPITSWHTFGSNADCSYWRFVGMELWNRGAAYGTSGPGGAAVSPRLSDIVRIGTSTSTQNSTSLVPNHILFDRCYVHGDWALYPCRNAIFNNGNYVGILGCDMGEVYMRGNETHVISTLNCDGPLHVENTSLHDSSCVFFNGGAGVALGSPHLPSDFAIIDCYFWRAPSSLGTVHLDTVKNHFELKSARRILLADFVMDGNWTDSQDTAIKLKTLAQAGQGIPWAEVIDVTVWNGIIQNTPEAFGLIGNGNEDAITSSGSQRHDLFNILVKPLDVAPYNGTGAKGSMFNITGPFNGLVIEHCTGFMSFNSVSGAPVNVLNMTLGTAAKNPAGANLTVQNFVYKNNISGRYPPALRFLLGAGAVNNTQGTNALNTFAPGAVWANNLITGLINGSSDTAANNPQNGTAGVSGNKYTTVGTSGGTTLARADILFTTDTDPNVYGDWTLQGGSPAKSAADDGRDMGVIWTLLTARTARALSGAVS